MLNLAMGEMGVPGGGVPFRPSKLFAAGEVGAWYDPSDLTTLFQESAGTTPVTAVEQPVGLMLDKSKGLVLGPELVPAASSWTGSANWSVNTTTATATLVNASATSDDLTLGSLSSSFVGQVFKVTLRVVSISGGTVTVSGSRLTTFGTPTFSSPGTYTYYLSSNLTGAGSLIVNISAAGVSCVVDSISIKELPGNHAFQSVSASRPVLSARVNLLERTEEFDNAYWTKSGLSVSANADGSADLIIPTAVSGSHVFQRAVTVSSSTTYTLSIKAKKSGYRYFYFGQISGPTSARVFDFDTGTYGTSTGSATYTATSLSDGYWLLTMTFTTGAAVSSITVEGASQPVTGFATFTGDGVSGAFIKDADLRVTNDGVGIPAYQRVAASTDYSTDGFPLYLSFDGNDDSMLTNSINFSSTDKMTVFAGVRKLSDAAIAGYIAETSANALSSNGAFYVAVLTSGRYEFTSRGTANAYATTTVSAYPVPLTNVMTNIGDIAGDVATVRINGTQAATSATDQGTGNYGNYPLYIGRRNNASWPYNGRLYSLIVRGAQSTSSQISATESWVNQKTKAY